jgi:hypothetical protein
VRAEVPAGPDIRTRLSQSAVVRRRMPSVLTTERASRQAFTSLDDVTISGHNDCGEYRTGTGLPHGPIQIECIL